MVEVPAIFLSLARSDGKNPLLWQKQCLEIAAICSVKCGSLLAFEFPNHFRLEHALNKNAVSVQGLRQLQSIVIHRVIRFQDP
jgi:hypothetical protein